MKAKLREEAERKRVVEEEEKKKRTLEYLQCYDSNILELVNKRNLILI